MGEFRWGGGRKIVCAAAFAVAWNGCLQAAMHCTDYYEVSTETEKLTTQVGGLQSLFVHHNQPILHSFPGRWQRCTVNTTRAWIHFNAWRSFWIKTTSNRRRFGQSLGTCLYGTVYPWVFWLKRWRNPVLIAAQTPWLFWSRIKGTRSLVHGQLRTTSTPTNLSFPNGRSGFTQACNLPAVEFMDGIQGHLCGADDPQRTCRFVFQGTEGLQWWHRRESPVHMYMHVLLQHVCMITSRSGVTRV